MGTRPECTFDSYSDRKYIFCLFHYGAKPCPNFDQLLVNFGSQLGLAFGQLPEPTLSQLLDPALLNCWLTFQPTLFNCWVALESNFCNIGVTLGKLEQLCFNFQVTVGS